MNHLSRIGSVVWIALAAGATAGSAAPDAPCGPYPPPDSSAYVLPFPPGKGHPLLQGNCSPHKDPWTHFDRARYAYDFGMPIGTPILAARGGKVVFVRDGFSDRDHGKDQGNVLLVQHDDGTLAMYGHLTQHGARVKAGDVVAQGDTVALSGDSGESPKPHLHFEVEGCADLSRCETVPVSFRNVVPRVDRLEKGRAYSAEAVPATR